MGRCSAHANTLARVLITRPTRRTTPLLLLSVPVSSSLSPAPAPQETKTRPHELVVRRAQSRDTLRDYRISIYCCNCCSLDLRIDCRHVVRLRHRPLHRLFQIYFRERVRTRSAMGKVLSQRNKTTIQPRQTGCTRHHHGGLCLMLHIHTVGSCGGYCDIKQSPA